MITNSDFTIMNYGIFDTKKAFPNLKKTRQRECNVFEIEYFINCDGTAYVDDKPIKLYQNTVLLCKPGQVRYSLLNFKCYFLHFAVSPDSKYYNILINSPELFYNIEFEIYASLFVDIIKYKQEKNPISDDIVFAKMVELVCQIAHDSKGNLKEYSQKNTKNNSNIVTKIIDYLHKNYENKITLADLACEFYYSPNYIQSQFSKATNISPQQYLEKIRLKKAKLLLADQTNSIADTALMVGFSSQSHFTACFRKRFGVTPKKWQEAAIRRAKKCY